MQNKSVCAAVVGVGKWADTGQTPPKYSLPHWLEWKGRMGEWSSIKAYS